MRKNHDYKSASNKRLEDKDKFWESVLCLCNLTMRKSVSWIIKTLSYQRTFLQLLQNKWPKDYKNDCLWIEPKS